MSKLNIGQNAGYTKSKNDSVPENYPNTIVEAVYWDDKKKLLSEVLSDSANKTEELEDKKLNAPVADGSAGQVLALDANGKPAWVNAATGGTYDGALSDSSTNAPQNKVVTAKLSELGQDVDALSDYVKGTLPTPTPTTYDKWYVDTNHKYQDLHVSVPSFSGAMAVYDVEGIASLSVTIPKMQGGNAIAFDNVLPVSGQVVGGYQTTTSGTAFSGVVANSGYKYLIISYVTTNGVPTVTGSSKTGGIEQEIDEVSAKHDALESKLYSSEQNIYKNEAEEAGSEDYRYPGGSGLVHLASENETFNRVGVGLRYANSNENVTITLKMGASVTAAGGTILKQFSVKPSELSTELFYIDLDEKVTLPAGSYLWIYSASSTYGVPFRVWSNNTLGTRVGMYFSGGIDVYKYSTAFRLLIREGDIPTLQREVASVLDIPAPDMVEISDLYVVKGVRQKFYYNTFIHGIESDHGNTLDGYTIEATCSTSTIGTADNEGIEIFSATAGTYAVNFTIYDSLRRKVKTFSVNVHVADANDLTGKNILMVGDSWTDPSFYNVSQYPTGKGYAVNTAIGLQNAGSVANFVGSKFAGNTDIYCEGRGGWAWLTYVGNTSPFYNNGSIDFTHYRSQIGLSGNFDYVSFQLGVNDCLGNRKSTADWQTTLEAVTTLINAVLADSPSCKVIINPVGLDAPGNTGWTSLNGLSVNKQIYQANAYDLSHLVHELVTARSDYGTKVFMGQSYFGVNRWYGYGYIDGRKRFFKVDTGSMSAADLATLEGWDFKTNPKYMNNGSKEWHIEGYQDGYLIAIDQCRYRDWNSHVQEFVNQYSVPQDTTPGAGSLTQTSGTGLPTIPFTACYIENNDLHGHYFMNASHPYDYGFTQLGRCLANQLLVI